MAHIATCVANADRRSSRHTSPQPSSLDKPHSWRMLPSDGQHRYQLFPKHKPSTRGKGLDPESAFAYAMADKTDKSNAAPPLRLRPNTRRRKVLNQDAAPMTTVHELPMDSPTIPGRPALHERSISAPKENTAGSPRGRPRHGKPDSAESPSNLTPTNSTRRNRPAPLLQSRVSTSKHRSGSAPPCQSPRTALEASPLSQQLLTPCASTPDLSLPRSATTDGTSATALSTPMSAPFTEPRCASPKSWDDSCLSACSSAYSDDTSPPVADRGHERNVSESPSTTHRGRPRQRGAPPGSEICRKKDKNSPLPAPPSCNDEARDSSLERQAFADLPRGWRPCDALEKLSAVDCGLLQKQAYRQAEKFEVLATADVEALSKELRQLDQRADYLRSTYKSLRAGRRSLHSRICQYLRSPRTSRFSHESMLRQEEALAELDDSIDDWVSKLERVENRRTRVRQKLLEHVAAATLLPVPSSPAASCESLQQIMGIKSPVPSGVSTPPRSPTRGALCDCPVGEPLPSQRVVDQVPSPIIEQPTAEEEEEKEAALETRDSLAPGPRRADVESIRVYMGGDVFALLADVEDEISRLRSDELPAKSTRHHEDPERQGSREEQASDAPASTPSSTPLRTPCHANEGFHEMMESLPPPPPPKNDTAPKGEFLLTSAVFKP